MKLQGQKGAAAIEFALVLPILVVLAFGIIEFSILLFDKAVITNASREGARYGSVFVPTSEDPITYSDIDNVIATYVANHLITFDSDSAATGVTTSYEPDPCCPLSGENLRVTVSYDYHFLVIPNFITSISGEPITIVAETVMVKE